MNTVVSKFLEIDGVVIEVRDYGNMQFCRTNPKRNPNLMKTWIVTTPDLSFDELLSYLVQQAKQPEPASSTHSIRLNY